MCVVWEAGVWCGREGGVWCGRGRGVVWEEGKEECGLHEHTVLVCYAHISLYSVTCSAVEPQSVGW